MKTFRFHRWNNEIQISTNGTHLKRSNHYKTTFILADNEYRTLPEYYFINYPLLAVYNRTTIESKHTLVIE